jgi:hypothetical protein
MKSITVAMVKIAAKKTKDTTKPIPESTTSLRLVWTFFSNSFIATPPIFKLIISDYLEKIHKQRVFFRDFKGKTHFVQTHA